MSRSNRYGFRGEQTGPWLIFAICSSDIEINWATIVGKANPNMNAGKDGSGFRSQAGLDTVITHSSPFSEFCRGKKRQLKLASRSISCVLD